MSTNRPGLFHKMWKNIKKSLVIYRKKDIYVGADELGNKYYERVNDETNNLKRQRKVVALSEDTSEVPDVPVEWMTWLRGRRIDPPTINEIAQNREQTKTVLARAARLEGTIVKNLEDLSPAQKAILSSKFPEREEFEKIPGEKDK